MLSKEIKDSIYSAIMEDVSVIVKKHLSEFENISNDEEYSELLNIDNVSENEIEQSSRLEYYFFNRPAFDSPLNEHIITEAIKKIFTPEEAKDIVAGKYNLFDWQIKVAHSEHHNIGIIKFIVILPEDLELIGNVKKDLDKLGYFLASTRNISYRGSERFKGYIFEPYNQENISDKIREYDFLYHVTPVTNLESILKRGLVLKSSKNTDLFAYPERIYLIDESHDVNTLYKAAELLYKTRRRNNKNAECIYAIIMIDIKKIPESVEMYYDPNYKHGIWVVDNIPAKTIENIELYDCEKQRYVKYSIWNKIKSKILSLFKR